MKSLSNHLFLEAINTCNSTQWPHTHTHTYNTYTVSMWDKKQATTAGIKKQQAVGRSQTTTIIVVKTYLSNVRLAYALKKQRNTISGSEESLVDARRRRDVVKDASCVPMIIMIMMMRVLNATSCPSPCQLCAFEQTGGLRAASDCKHIQGGLWTQKFASFNNFLDLRSGSSRRERTRKQSRFAYSPVVLRLESCNGWFTLRTQNIEATAWS